MATTIAFFSSQIAMYPAANMGAPGVRNNRFIMQFDASTTEAVYFRGVVPETYTAANMSAKILWSAASATSGDARLRLAIERMNDGEDADVDSFDTTSEVLGTAPGTNGDVKVSTFLIILANQDGMAAGDTIRVRFDRPVDGSDTMTGDLELYSILFTQS